MRINLVLVVALALLAGCAGGKIRPEPREAPGGELATFGPSQIIRLR
jgi:hypothetical protein